MSSPKKTTENKTKTSTKDDMRRLWINHGTLTKMYIESFLEDSKDIDAITTKLFQNQVDIGTYVGQKVGADKGTQLTTLLKAHISAAAGFVSAAKTGTQANIDAATKAFFDNGTMVATFLSSLNPKKLPLNNIQDMFATHIGYVISMTDAHLDSNYTNELQIFDTYITELIIMSDSINDAVFGCSCSCSGSCSSSCNCPSTCPCSCNRSESCYRGDWIWIIVVLLIIVFVIIWCLYYFRANPLKLRTLMDMSCPVMTGYDS